MVKQSKLGLLKPLLKQCTTYEGGSKIVIDDGQAQIVLPKEYLEIIELLDGKNSVKDISSKLYCSSGTVKLHSIITTIKLLSEAGMLEGVATEFKDVQTDKSPHEQKPSILSRSLFEIKLMDKLSINYPSDHCFFGLILLLSSFLVINNDAFAQLNLARFLKSPSGYPEALLRIFLFSSLLMNLKRIFQAAMLLLATGKMQRPCLSIYPYAVAIGVDDKTIYSHPKKSVILSYGIVSAILYLCSYTILETIPYLRIYRNDLAVISILLTFIELNPYRRSDLTKLFFFFYAENQLKSIMPYLKNCTLSGIWKNTNSRLSDEIRYISYSILAISWAIGFGIFSLEMILKTFPGLFYQIQLGASESKFQAIIVLSILLFITGYLLLDLIHTIIRNVLSPVMQPLLKLSSRPKPYTHEDLDMTGIKVRLMKNMLFNQLSLEAIENLLGHSKVKSIKKGSALIIQGDSNRDVFFLLSGGVDVSIREQTGRIKHIATLGPDTIIGEMAILEASQRTATVTATEDLAYLEFPEISFSALMNTDEFKQDYEKLKSRIEISRFVSCADLFKDFPPEIMNLFVEAGDLVLFPEGHNIVDEGESDKTFYLLIKGAVEVYKNSVKIAQLKQGDFFGEVALIANVPRTATVKTIEDSLFLYIEDEKFWNILSENIELAMYIESVGKHRMVEAA